MRLLSCLLFMVACCAPPAFAQAADSSDFGFVRPVRGDTQYGDVRILKEGTQVSGVRIGTTSYDISQVMAFRADSTLFVMHARTTPDQGERKPERLLLRQTQGGALSLYVRADGVPDGTFEFFSVYDGPLQEATTRRLEQTLRESPASQRWLAVAKRWRAAEYSLIAAGAAVVGYGALVFLREADAAFDLNAYLPLGFVIGISSGYPRQQSRKAWHRAIDAYGS